eukprot:SAG11_NODE_692_length_7698_cov_4.143308_6_plen_86_part_00
MTRAETAHKAASTDGRHSKEVVAVAATACGRVVLSVAKDGQLKAWDVARNALLDSKRAYRVMPGVEEHELPRCLAVSLFREFCMQ